MAKQNEPTVERSVNITYGGEPRVLKFGILALKSLGMNPFQPASIEAFKARPMDLGLASDVIAAGLLHEYHGKKATRRGEIPPTANDVLADMCEIDEFVATFKSVLALFGEDEQPGDDKPAAESKPADPPAA